MIGCRARVPVAIGMAGDVSSGLLSYRDIDPYVVTFEIRQPDSYDTVTWILSRDMLAEGTCSRKPVGEGDIRVWKCHDGSGVHFELSSPQGSAVLHVASSMVDDFLCETFSIVAEGNESHYVDMDGICRQLLEGA